MTAKPRTLISVRLSPNQLIAIDALIETLYRRQVNDATISEPTKHNRSDIIRLAVTATLNDQ